MQKVYQKYKNCVTVYHSVNSQYINWKFYKQYLTKEPPFSQIGLIVYLRTYSRYLPKVKRREKWCETVLRVVEHSLSLDTKTSHVEKKKEAEKLFDAIFNLRLFPAGRALWVGGTEAVKRSPSAVFNCSYSNIDSLSAIVEGFYLLLVGAGFGFSIEDKYTSQLPKLNKDLKVYHKPYRTWNQHCSFPDSKVWLWHSEKNITLPTRIIKLNDDEFDKFISCQIEEHEEFVLKIGDSKEGWCTALKFLLWAYSKSFESVSIDYGYVRPKGTPLKTFGGRASGHEALQEFFERIHTIINESSQKTLQSTQILDICNAMGAAVVVGGVRRSSEIALGDVDNIDFIEAKKDLWSDPNKAHKTAYRTMSNNSVVLYDNPGLDWFTNTMKSVQTNGEPGFVSISNANKKLLKRCNKFKLNFLERKGTNPCSEILLDSKGVCNLSEVNINAHVVGGKINWSLLEESITLATRVGSRMTLIDMFHPEWDKVQKRDRLLGVSLTGIMTAFDRLSDTDSTTSKYLFEYLQNVVNDESFKYHDQLGIPRPLLATCIKPSGTLSLLPGVSPGIHRDYAPYYLRRVRVSNADPIAHALRSLGVPCCPENGQGDDLDSAQCKTWVFTFPIQTNAPIRSIDESAIEQLERYKSVMKYYVQHNCSVTISVDKLEWNDVAKWLYENYDDFVGVSFLPKFETHNSPYPQLPMESCDEKTYKDLYFKMPHLTEDQFIELIASKETFYEEYELDNNCSSGACPVR